MTQSRQPAPPGEPRGPARTDPPLPPPDRSPSDYLRAHTQPDNLGVFLNEMSATAVAVILWRAAL